MTEADIAFNDGECQVSPRGADLLKREQCGRTTGTLSVANSECLILAGSYWSTLMGLHSAGTSALKVSSRRLN